MSRILKISLCTLLLLVVAVALFIGNFVARHKEQQPQMFSDPVFEIEAPVFHLPASELSVLVFSKTNGFRHHEAIPAANKLMQTFAVQDEWAIALTENSAVFNAEQLSGFDLVVWNNVTGPALTPDQQAAFEAYVQGGGAYLGIHAAGDGSHKDWAWYAKEVIRSRFTMHPLWPQIQSATLNLDASRHPITQSLPDQWQMRDEWYSFESSVRGQGSEVLLTIAENSYDPNLWSMGDDHPLGWAHELGEGRVVYLAPGHLAASYENEHFQRLVRQSIDWATKTSQLGHGQDLAGLGGNLAESAL